MYVCAEKHICNISHNTRSISSHVASPRHFLPTSPVERGWIAVTLKKVLTLGLAPMNCTVASISCWGSCVRAMRTRGRCDTLQSGLCRLPGGPIVCLSISCARARSQLFLHVFGRYASVEASASPRLLLGQGMHLSNQGQAWRGISYNWSDVRYSLETSCCQQD